MTLANNFLFLNKSLLVAKIKYLGKSENKIYHKSDHYRVINNNETSKAGNYELVRNTKYLFSKNI